MAGESLHEDRTVLGPDILDRHRAISTLMEELEAIDWYDQRIQASENQELRAVLLHNRNDETEHASMLLEWLRRHDAAFDQQMTKYLFTSGPIREAGATATASRAGAVNAAAPATNSPTTNTAATNTAATNSAATNSLGIGSLRAAITARLETE